jgi:putative nucleotidyltransferase with HDIG domain
MAIRVLAVDDQSAITRLVCQYLTTLGYEPLSINDSRQALDAAKSFRPEICILDISMPYIEGPELLNRIKACDPSTEVILLTGVDDARMAVDLIRSGAADYLLKPVHLQDLEHAISRAVEHRRLNRESIAYKLRLELLVVERSKALDEALHELSRIHNATMETLAMALDYRDRETYGHSRRVADMTLQIARAVGPGSEDLVQIEHGALLHDIGKLRIPDRILRKPGKLSLDEWEIMRKHPEYGYEFVSKIEFLSVAADIILSHHEKFDGSGYPRGLKGSEISLGARIFAIVDSVDAMIYDRPYRKGIAISEAIQAIVSRAGTDFDPALVRAALPHIERYRRRPANQLTLNYDLNLAAS